MVKKIKWVERKFDFNVPFRVFPSIIERLRGTPARVEELIRSFPAAILTTRVDNRWSIQEHVGHLSDLEELHNGRIDDYIARAKVLRPADVGNKKTWEADHNANSIQNILASFQKGRHQFVERLEHLDEETIAASALHPRLQQQMRLIDFAFFVAEHDDHHGASITELAKVLRAENKLSDGKA